MNLREAELARPAAEWLRSQGYTVYAEVPVANGAAKIDLVGRANHVLVAVELKRHLSRGAIHQAYRNQSITPNSWCVVGSMPTTLALDGAKRLGVGVAALDDGSLRVLHLPGLPLHSPERWQHDRVEHYLDHMAPSDVGGRPTLKGEGAAIECRARLLAYVREHGRRSWSRLYAAVPNHYASVGSFRAHMREAIADPSAPARGAR